MQPVFCVIFSGVEEAGEDEEDNNDMEGSDTQRLTGNSNRVGVTSIDEPSASCPDPHDTEYVVGGALMLQRFKALMWLRFIGSHRNKTAVFFRIVVPVIFMIIGTVLLKNSSSSVSQRDPQPLQFTPGMYNKETATDKEPNMVYFKNGTGEIFIITLVLPSQ